MARTIIDFVASYIIKISCLVHDQSKYIYLLQRLCSNEFMDIAALLNSEFEKRKNKNNRYSLRAFAKTLKMDPTALLRIMQEERIPTLAICTRIITALGMEQDYKPEDLKTSMASQKKQKQELLKNTFDATEFDTLFEANHLYVLSALRTTILPLPKIKSQLRKTCGINEADFNKIIKDLQLIGAIKVSADGIEVVHKHKSTVPIPFTSEKRRSLQKEFLSGGIKAIDKIPFEERVNATLTLSLSHKDWAQVQRILKDARAKINRLSEKNRPPDTVYNICMAAYPVVKLS